MTAPLSFGWIYTPRVFQEIFFFLVCEMKLHHFILKNWCKIGWKIVLNWGKKGRNSIKTWNFSLSCYPKLFMRGPATDWRPLQGVAPPSPNSSWVGSPWTPKGIRRVQKMHGWLFTRSLKAPLRPTSSSQNVLSWQEWHTYNNETKYKFGHL